MMQQRNFDYAIGIDLGTKTGVSLWNINKQTLVFVDTMEIDDALFEVATLIEKKYLIVIIFEDVKHISGKGIKAQGAGSIKRDQSIWERFCEKRDIPFKAVRPNHQNNPFLKTGDNEADINKFKLYTGWPKETSTHSRDAAGLVFGLKNPIII